MELRPVLGQLDIAGRPRQDHPAPSSGVALGRVVDEPARLADPALSGSGLHGRERSVTLAAVEYERDALEQSGEHYNPGEPTTPRQASSVILLRGGADDMEILLVKRNP